MWENVFAPASILSCFIDILARHCAQLNCFRATYWQDVAEDLLLYCNWLVCCCRQLSCVCLYRCVRLSCLCLCADLCLRQCDSMCWGWSPRVRKQARRDSVPFKSCWTNICNIQPYSLCYSVSHWWFHCLPFECWMAPSLVPVLLKQELDRHLVMPANGQLLVAATFS